MKPVPDPASRLIINETKTWIKDQDLTFVASEADNYALEEALRLKEKHGGEVVVHSMGGEEAARVLRSGLAMGADRAIHLPIQSSKAQTNSLQPQRWRRPSRKMAAPISCWPASQSDDLGTGNDRNDDGGIPRMDSRHRRCRGRRDSGREDPQGRRELEGGINEAWSWPMPAVLTIQFGINQPRYASLKGIMAAKKKDFKAWSAAIRIDRRRRREGRGDVRREGNRHSAA